MPKSSSPSTLKKLEITDDWSHHPAIEWFMNHKKTLLWIFLGFLVLLIAASRYASTRTLNAEHDYFQAQHAFTQFQKESLDAANGVALSDLEQLETLMAQHPEMKPKYQGDLAQTLLVTGHVPQAQQFAEDIFKRTQHDTLQHYQDYSRTSLLIGEGHYEEALTQAQQLKTTLERLDTNENSLLYVYNLIRIAMLYQQTGQPKEELNTWDDLQGQILRLDAMLAANRVFKIGQSSLNHYIEERKKALNQ